MIVRKLNNDKIVIVKLIYTPEQEAKFIEQNSAAGFMSVDSLPHSDAYPFYKNYKWENDTIVVDDIANAAEKLQDDIKEAQAYLNSTDWYYIRKIEEDIAVPEDVITARATAKELIRTSS